MTRTIAQRELRNDNAHIIDAVARGESFIVTRNGLPVAELRPISTGRRAFVPKADLAAVASGSGHIDAEAFRRDIDSLADQTVVDERWSR